MTTQTKDRESTSRPALAEAAGKAFRSDKELEELVDGLVGAAIREQVWLIFLDEEHRPKPLVVPFDGLGEVPGDEEVGRFVELARDVAIMVGGRRVVLTWERPGPEGLSAAEERLVARVATRFAATADVSLRAQLLSHSVGVRVVRPGG